MSGWGDDDDLTIAADGGIDGGFAAEQAQPAEQAVPVTASGAAAPPRVTAPVVPLAGHRVSVSPGTEIAPTHGHDQVETKSRAYLRRRLPRSGPQLSRAMSAFLADIHNNDKQGAS